MHKVQISHLLVVFLAKADFDSECYESNRPLKSAWITCSVSPHLKLAELSAPYLSAWGALCTPQALLHE